MRRLWEPGDEKTAVFTRGSARTSPIWPPFCHRHLSLTSYWCCNSLHVLISVQITPQNTNNPPKTSVVSTTGGSQDWRRAAVSPASRHPSVAARRPCSDQVPHPRGQAIRLVVGEYLSRVVRNLFFWAFLVAFPNSANRPHMEKSG